MANKIAQRNNACENIARINRSKLNLDRKASHIFIYLGIRLRSTQSHSVIGPISIEARSSFYLEIISEHECPTGVYISFHKVQPAY